MIRILLCVALVLTLAVPVSAMDFTAPAVPESGSDYLDETPETFSEGLLKILGKALDAIYPAVTEGAGMCLRLLIIMLMTSLLNSFSGASEKVIGLAACSLIAVTLLQSTGSMIKLGADTVRELSEYGKLLFPVMTAAMAANGATTGSVALYTGTVALDSVLAAVVSGVVLPMIYIYLALSVASSATGQPMLTQLKKFAKWLLTWSLKIVLYVFTGYLGITGVVSGTADAAAVKAAKLTISGVVPVVGGILSDASETILVTAGVMKSAVGIYGMLALMAVWIGPFIKIGVQYLLLKMTCGISDIFGHKQGTGLIKDFSSAMGMLLAMTGTVCLLLLISTFCMMKGFG